MFLTFTPNPCLERTYRIAHFEAGTSQRVSDGAVNLSAGGKGLNAARVAALFGARAIALAPVGARQFDFLWELAKSDRLTPDFVGVESDTRVCLNIVDERGQNTEIIENGAPISVQTAAQLLEKWRQHLPRARLAAIGGAYPPSQNTELENQLENHAAILCQMAARAGVPLIYDGRGAAFSRALKSQTPPWAIKPNLAEAELMLGRSLETEADERRAVRDLRAMGAEIVLLSCGSRGLYVGHCGGIEWLEAPRVELVSSVGCGDALVGAFAAKWLAGAGLIEAARWGVAAGSASAAQLLPAHVCPDEAAALCPLVSVHSAEIGGQSA